MHRHGFLLGEWREREGQKGNQGIFSVKLGSIPSELEAISVVPASMVRAREFAVTRPTRSFDYFRR